MELGVAKLGGQRGDQAAHDRRQIPPDRLVVQDGELTFHDRGGLEPDLDVVLWSVSVGWDDRRLRDQRPAPQREQSSEGYARRVSARHLLIPSST